MSTADETPLYLTETTYVADPNDELEMTRLVQQDSLITQGMGGLFPEQSDLSSIHSILDIACGPGGWALQVAQTYPEIEVTGVDLSIRMIMYARAQALIFDVPNAHFRLMDVLKPLDFPDGSFDMVNARLLFAFMPPPSWPTFLQECLRVTRPGGIIRLTECEFPLTSSPAVEEINALTIRAFHLAGKSFSPDGHHIAITPVLSSFLHDAGCQNIQQKAHVLDYSAGKKAREYFYSDYKTSFQVGLPFLLKSGLTTAEAFNTLYQQALKEIWSEEFRAIQFFLTVWGERP